MFDLYQLRQFLAVVEHETVSKAADALNMTQPALSRSLQNLEYELELPLFDRGKNKITLNDSGRMAAEEARALLAAADSMKSRLQDYYRQNHSIIIASCAPCPALGIAERAVKELFPAMDIETEIIDDQTALEKALAENACQLAIFPRQVEHAGLVQVPVYTENLYAMIPDSHPLAARSGGLYLSDINGQAVIPLPLKGYWNTLLEAKLPDSQKLYQSSVEAFATLIQSAAMICFVSDVRLEPLPGHQRLPLLDAEAHISYHLACTKANRDRFRQLMRAVESK